MLSRREWMEIAERSAAVKFGDRHYRKFMVRRFVAGPAGIATALGACGWGAWWIWSHIHAPSAPGGISGTALAVVAFLLLIGTLIVLRPRAVPTPAHLLIVRVAVLGFAWLGLAAYSTAALIG